MLVLACHALDGLDFIARLIVIVIVIIRRIVSKGLSLLYGWITDGIIDWIAHDARLKVDDFTRAIWIS